MAGINYLFPPDQIDQLSAWRFALHFQAPSWFRKRKTIEAEEHLAQIRLKITEIEPGPLEYDPTNKTVAVNYNVPEERRHQEGALEHYESDVWKIIGNMALCGFDREIFYEAKEWRDG